MPTLRKIAINLCRFIFAGVFIFSGFVKLIDPLGFTYKIQDYLEAFGPFFETFSFLALPASILLSAVEFLIGVNLLLGIYRRNTTILAILFMAVMLPLTLYIAIFDPVTDCGCFGDALIISNWNTFYKNIFLTAIAILLFMLRKDITPFVSHKNRIWATSYTLLFSVLLSLYCYQNLPIIDFRPYKTNNNIAELSQIPEGMPGDVYEITVVYEKDGLEQEFTLENYPAGDSTWTYVDTKSKLVQKGYEPPIHDFSITLVETGDDITREVLADSGYTFLLISYKLEKASLKNTEKINRIYDYAQSNNYAFYCLTSSLSDDIEDYIQETGARYPMANTDEITLKTIVRSNPGLLLLQKGTILHKWHHRNLPEFAAPLEGTKLGQVAKPTAVRSTVIASLILIIPLLLIVLTDRRKRKNK